MHSQHHVLVLYHEHVVSIHVQWNVHLLTFHKFMHQVILELNSSAGLSILFSVIAMQINADHANSADLCRAQ